jgi:hypothetical protein
MNDCFLYLAIKERRNWTHIGYDSFGENSSDFFLAANDRNRGTTEVHGAELKVNNVQTGGVHQRRQPGRLILAGELIRP